jgi:enoyl-CoA hydratase/carnithine racemase
MIIVIDHGRIRELRLNRPPANALTSELLDELRQQIENAPAHNVGALILSGAPGMFSAGLDIPALTKLDREQITGLWKNLYATIGALACSPIPICAAITGHAPAGGTVLAIFCDWRIAAQGNFQIGVSEVQVGLPLPPIILHGLRRLVGPREAERLAVRGLLLGSENAAQLGLVDEVVPMNEVVTHAVTWCEELLKLPQSAMTFTRQQARTDLTALFSCDLSTEIGQMSEAWWQPGTQSMLASFAERLLKKKAQVSS